MISKPLYFKAVRSGTSTIFFIDEKNDLWVVGSGASGILGLSKNTKLKVKERGRGRREDKRGGGKRMEVGRGDHRNG